MTLDERVTAPNASTFSLPSFAFWTLSPDHPPNNLQVTPYIYMRVYILLNMPNTWSMISFETTLTAIKILLLLATFYSNLS